MKRSTISLIAAAAILLVGGSLIWILIIAPRLARPTETPVTTPPPTETAPPEKESHDVLNLYLTAPQALPAGVARAELTLTKATLSGEGEIDVIVFSGNRKVMLQAGTVEKVLSEMIPDGHWNRLKLEFSPASDLSMNGGTTEGALVGRREATLSFDAEFPVSRTLALFARLPLEPRVSAADGAAVIDLLPDPQAADAFVLGGYLLDLRGRGAVWAIPAPSLASAIKKDIGLDITVVKQGSQGFTGSDAPPSTTGP